MELTPRRVHEGTLGKYLLLQPSRHVGPSVLISFSYTAFMFESSMPFAITDFAIKSEKRHGTYISCYDVMQIILTTIPRTRARNVE